MLVVTAVVQIHSVGAALMPNALLSLPPLAHEESIWALIGWVHTMQKARGTMVGSWMCEPDPERAAWRLRGASASTASQKSRKGKHEARRGRLYKSGSKGGHCGRCARDVAEALDADSLTHPKAIVPNMAI